MINETKSNVTFVGNNVIFGILGAAVTDDAVSIRGAAVTVDQNNVDVSILGAAVTVDPNNVDVSIRGAVAVSIVIAVLVLFVVVKLARIRLSSGKDLHVKGSGASWSSGFYMSKHNNILHPLLCHFYNNTKW